MSAAGGAESQPLGVATGDAVAVLCIQFYSGQVATIEGERGFEAQLATVAAAGRGERPLAVPGEWVRFVMSVLLAAEESSRTRREVPLAP